MQAAGQEISDLVFDRYQQGHVIKVGVASGVRGPRYTTMEQIEMAHRSQTKMQQLQVVEYFATTGEE